MITRPHILQAGQVEVDGPVGFVFQNPDHQVVMPTVAADVAFGLGRHGFASESGPQSGSKRDCEQTRVLITC